VSNCIFSKLFRLTAAAAVLLFLQSPVAQVHAQAANLQSSAPNPKSVLPELSDAQADRLKPYLDMRSGTTYGWWPGGQGIMIGTRFGSSQQLHRVQAAMGARTQITFNTEPVLGVKANHSESHPTLLIQRDIGGAENFQLFGYNTQSIQETLLTEGGKTRNENPVFAPDGLSFAYSRTNESGLYQVRMQRVDKVGASTPIKIGGKLERSAVLQPLDFSPDGKSLLLLERRSILQSTLIELDIASGKTRRFGKDPGAASSQARYSLDGKQIYVLSDQGFQLQTVWMVDRKNRTFRPFLPALNGDVDMFSVSQNEHYLALSVNDDKGSELLVLDQLDGYKEVKRIKLEPGVISDLEFHPTKPVLAFTFSGAQIPSDSFTLDFPSKSLTQWTEHELGGISSKLLLPPQRAQTVGGTGEKAYNLQTWVYSSMRQGKNPVVIILHGGPESQSRPGFDAWIQYLVRELGVNVLTPNVRGSTGYGRDYTALDDGPLRADATADVGSILDWIKTIDAFDSERVIVMGGSYGGYLTLASLAAYSDRLRGGISVVGISDFTTFLANTANYRRDLRRVEYGDERVPAMRKIFDAISPLKNAARISAPLLIIQGANDPRVPLSEAIQIRDAVQANGKPAPMLVAGDEGHGFKKRANVDQMRATMAAFLIQHFGLTEAAAK
jgi:acetyl esterase/lipase